MLAPQFPHSSCPQARSRDVPIANRERLFTLGPIAEHAVLKWLRIEFSWQITRNVNDELT